jgi:hypothetical protein
MSTPAGKSWVAKFPTSKSVSDLSGGFKSKVTKFLAALDKAGAKVSINATYRPPERAYLMHWSYLIAKKNQDPAKVPAMKGVDIDWTAADKAGKADASAAKKAAQAMVDGYAIAYAPALKSRHTEGNAIDMDISWSGDLSITGADGKPVSITSTPRTGANKDLQKIGADYGVVKLPSDPPHWSSDGH